MVQMLQPLRSCGAQLQNRTITPAKPQPALTLSGTAAIFRLRRPASTAALRRPKSHTAQSTRRAVAETVSLPLSYWSSPPYVRHSTGRVFCARRCSASFSLGGRVRQTRGSWSGYSSRRSFASERLFLHACLRRTSSSRPPHAAHQARSTVRPAPPPLTVFNLFQPLLLHEIVQKRLFQRRQ